MNVTPRMIPCQGKTRHHPDVVHRRPVNITRRSVVLVLTEGRFILDIAEDPFLAQ